jgi:signal transduction histidine kinase
MTTPALPAPPLDGRRFGPPRAVRVWMPVVVSLVVQVPASLLLLAHQLSGSVGADAPAPGPGAGPDLGDGVRPGSGTFTFDSAVSAVWVAVVALVLAVLTSLALAVIRRYPRTVVVAIIAATSGEALLSPIGPPFISVAFAVILAVRHGARAWAYIALAAAWMLVVFLGPLSGAPWAPRLVAPTTLGLLVVVGAAEFSKRRSDARQKLYDDALARRRADEARQEAAGQQERVRIARELHDVLGHSLSQITVQANAGLHLMDRDPAEARRALVNVKETSAAALAEVRSVLGILRDPAPSGNGFAHHGKGPDSISGGSVAASESAGPRVDPVDSPGSSPRAPGPGIDRLGDLFETVRAGGVRVAESMSLGDPARIPLSVGQSAYRIVQESLTNVVRHSPSASARVRIDRNEDALIVTIEDDGTAAATATAAATVAAPAPAPAPAPQPGNGLLGMRERAELLGGTFSAGPTPAGGWRVVATFPLEGRP